MNIEDRPVNRANRPHHTFKIPASLKEQTGVASVTLVELTGSEELVATQRAGGQGGAKMAYELAKEALRAVNGKPVTTADGTVDAAWEAMHPAIRSLVTQAYVKLHAVEKDTIDAFLKSHEVQVG